MRRAPRAAAAAAALSAPRAAGAAPDHNGDTGCDCAMKGDLRRCRAASGGGGTFHHWQVRHAAARGRRTYPLREWEHCASERRTCRCYTTARFGAGERWALRDVADAERGRPLAQLRCGAAAFPAPQATAATSSHVFVGLAAHCVDLPRDEGRTAANTIGQAAKGYRLPCNALAGAPLGGLPPDVGLVYSQQVRHWRWMPMNLTAALRDAVSGCFGVQLPARLPGGEGDGPRGNPHMPRLWQSMGWTHPCCQYTVMSREAHRAYAQFVSVVSLTIARAAGPTAAGAYCMTWRSGGGCVPRWYGYLGDTRHPKR
eukprot:gene19801-49638_t